MANISLCSAVLITLLLAAAAVDEYLTLPVVEKMLKDFLVWVDQDLGPWGPLVLAVAYIPLTVLAVPTSVLTLGGGYLFGLPVGFAADSVGACIGAAAAFLLGRTVGRPLVVSKLIYHPQFRTVSNATSRSGFKIVLLLRLVPLFRFSLLNYLLSVTRVPLGEYMLATWLGMMPITVASVYLGTTLKDLSDVIHGWDDFLTAHLVVLIALYFVVPAILTFILARVVKSAGLPEAGEILCRLFYRPPRPSGIMSRSYEENTDEDREDALNRNL